MSIGPNKISMRQWRGFQRRAVTIHLKALELGADMVAALGVEHQATDYSDGCLEQAENLVSHIDWQIKHKGARP